MFAEELAGNPAKKRADEAKARRLRAKREKEAKDARKKKEEERRREAAAAASGEVVSAVDGSSANAVSSSQPSAPANIIHTNIHPVSDTRNNATDKPPTAAQTAADQRKLRAELRHKHSCAILLQSLLRSRLISIRTRNEQRIIFDKRMSDLMSVKDILKTKGVEYIPPPATVSMMVVQFLFFAWSYRPKQGIDVTERAVIMEEQYLIRWANLMRHVILPGVMSTTSDLDPLIPWIDSFLGKRRLMKLFGLCVTGISRRRNKQSISNGSLNRKSLYDDLDLFLRRILRLEKGSGGDSYGGDARDEVHLITKSLLFKPSPSCNIIPMDGEGNCDLIQSLRYILLYGSDGKSAPIPLNADQLRDNCVAGDEKDRISTLFQLAVDYLTYLVANGKSDASVFCSRFLVEVLTVPLLTWKVKPEAYEKILSTSKSRQYPPLIGCIQSFIDLNPDKVSNCCIDEALEMNDVSLTTCPAPAVLCLLSNLIQLGKQCVTLNGSDRNKLHFKAAAEYHNFLANLINAAPLGIFSRRMSAVEWVYTGSSSTPIVLSEVVVEQASALLADSYVRTLFRCAIDDNALDTEKVISTKTDKDKSYEKDLEDIGTESVSSLAAKEAMVDRNRSFWQGTWAKKLTRSVNALISGPAEKQKAKPPLKGPGQLMNTSSIARQLADGKGSVNRIVTSAVLSSGETEEKEESSGSIKLSQEYNIVFLLSLCKCILPCLALEYEAELS